MKKLFKNLLIFALPVFLILGSVGYCDTLDPTKTKLLCHFDRYSDAVIPLSDDFNDNSLDTAKWTVYSGTVNETGGQLQFVPVSGTSAYLYSPNTYNLTGKQATLKIVDAGNITTGYNLHILYLWVDVNNYVWWQIYSNGNIYCSKVVSGVMTDVYSNTYNANTYRYIKIREDGGTTYWDYSSDGASWTNAHSEANPITLTNVEIDFEAIATTTTTVKLDDFNILPSSINGPTTYYSDDTNARTATFYNSAQLSTTQKVFGNSSLLLASATSNYITFPGSSDFTMGTGDFTVGFRTYFTSLPTTDGYPDYIIDTRYSSSSEGFQIWFDTNNYFGFSDSGNNDYYTTSTPTLNTWESWEIDVTGGNVYFFKDGTLVSTQELLNTTFTAGTTLINMSRRYSGGYGYIDGYIDELYILKGQALHTANYTVPTSAYTVAQPLRHSIGCGIGRGIFRGGH